jgi:type II secretory pathway pseudopilin PulG
MRGGKDNNHVQPKSADSGFTYLGILVVVLIMGITMQSTFEIWHTTMQRENEQELIYVGHQFQYAIGKYYNWSGGHYPPNLEAMLGATDQQPMNNRFLRKIYRDPITKKQDWVLISGKAGEVIGVHSASSEEPFKKGGFSKEDVAFEGKEHYADWLFVYTPRLNQYAMPPNMVNGYVRPVPRIN